MDLASLLKRKSVRFYVAVWIAVAALTAAVNMALRYYLSHHRFTAIVVHHSASEADNYRTIRKLHRQKHNWRDAGYHLILSNGKAGVPMGYLEATSRYRWLSYSLATRNRWCNLHAVHICIVGNYDEHPVPQDLKPAIAHALWLLQKRFHIPDDRILLHRNCNSTRCPGRYITKAELVKWVRTLPNRCPERIRRQQSAVIDNARCSLRSNPLLLATSLFSLTLMVVVSAAILYVIKRSSKEEGTDARR